MLAVITWLFPQPGVWKRLGRKPYEARHVNALYRAVAANLRIPHRFICLTDEPDGIECETLPCLPAITVGGEDSCYRRIRAFDGDFQRSLGDRVLSLDLDCVILDDITPLITDDDCRMLAGSIGTNGYRVSYYNGSMWLCKSGARSFVWDEFTPEKAKRMREELIMPCPPNVRVKGSNVPGKGVRVKGSDQSWFSAIMGPNEKVWTPADGVTQYRMISKSKDLTGLRMVFFAGKFKPYGQNVRRNFPALYDAWARYDTPRMIQLRA